MKKNNSLRSNSLFFIYNTVSWFLRISIIPAERWWQGIFFLLLKLAICRFHNLQVYSGSEIAPYTEFQLADHAHRRCADKRPTTPWQVKYSLIVFSVLYTQKSSIFLCAVRPVKEFAEILEIQVFALIQKTDCLNREAMSLTFSVLLLAKFCIS